MRLQQLRVIPDAPKRGTRMKEVALFDANGNPLSLGGGGGGVSGGGAQVERYVAPRTISVPPFESPWNTTWTPVASVSVDAATDIALFEVLFYVEFDATPDGGSNAALLCDGEIVVSAFSDVANGGPTIGWIQSTYQGMSTNDASGDPVNDLIHRNHISGRDAYAPGVTLASDQAGAYGNWIPLVLDEGPHDLAIAFGNDYAESGSIEVKNTLFVVRDIG